MTKTVEEVRRAAFDKWFDSLPWVMCEKCSRYEEIAWRGFKAGLDAVEIQLPGAHEAMKAVFDYQHSTRNKNVTGTTNWAANVGMVVVDDCRAAIEQTGLGLRIK